MARVVLSGGLHAQAPPGTPRQMEIEARDVRELLRKLEERLPGIQQRVEEGLAMSIDGDIVSDPLLEPLATDCEIHFLPPLQGGR